MLRAFAYQKPASVKAAAQAAARPGAHILAGGTDLLGCLRDGVFTADSVVSLSGLPALKGISANPRGGLRIGALTTLADVAGDARVQESYPVLAQAAASAASPQLRNQGTIGGNLCQRPRCWYYRGDFHCLRKGGDTCFAVGGENEYHCIFGGAPCFIVHPSDTAPALLALDARLSITGPRGSRTIPLSSFFVLPEKNVRAENILAAGEVITEILLGPPQTGARSLYRKVRDRGAFDFALAGAAVVVVMSDGKVSAARIVLSGVAPAPWRVPEAENLLAGRPLDAGAISQAAAAAVKGAFPLSKNEYKIALVRGILEETLASLA
ncbi:MAG: FAD binding domain-containing protein [Bryobacterales bacterium]|nr:FAD binding domain-containing protein [Bryobacterales bacterium]